MFVCVLHVVSQDLSHVCVCVYVFVCVCVCVCLCVFLRTVAPRNILFDDQNNPVLADFGLSRRVQSSSDGGGKTRYNRTEGLNVPIRWSAPEVLTGDEESFAADVRQRVWNQSGDN